MIIKATHTPKAIFHLAAASSSIPKLSSAPEPRLSVEVFSTPSLVVVSATTSVSVDGEVWKDCDVGEVVASDDRLVKANEFKTNFCSMVSCGCPLFLLRNGIYSLKKLFYFILVFLISFPNWVIKTTCLAVSVSTDYHLSHYPP